MESLSRTVKKTRAYSAFFDFPLTPTEIHRWLICDHPIPFTRLRRYTHPLTRSEKRHRTILYKNTQQKINQTLHVIRLLRFLPSIKMIALTGSVAIGNARSMDDIDLLIVTSPHTLWLTRPLVLFILSLFSRRRLPGQDYRTAAGTFCPNLWLETRSLVIPHSKRNLYTAHEVLQILPLYDNGSIYDSFQRQNSWTKNFLANALSYLHLSSKRGVTLSFALITSPFNFIAFLLQYLYMRSKITSESISLESAYFHKIDFATKIDRHLGRVLR